MSNVKIYGPAPSSYVRTTRMALVEKGVDYELLPIEFGSDAHRALHPYAKVPILEHGDVRLYETQAILRYIDARFDGPASPNAGTRGDFAQRAARHFLVEVASRAPTAGAAPPPPTPRPGP